LGDIIIPTKVLIGTDYKGKSFSIESIEPVSNMQMEMRTRAVTREAQRSNDLSPLHLIARPHQDAAWAQMLIKDVAPVADRYRNIVSRSFALCMTRVVTYRARFSHSIAGGGYGPIDASQNPGPVTQCFSRHVVVATSGFPLSVGRYPVDSITSRDARRACLVVDDTPVSSRPCR
jgi:hypothetical protein